MAIRSKDEMKPKKIEIDLSSPQGNVFYLMGLVATLGKQLGYTQDGIKEVQQEMMYYDYEYAINIFDAHFGDFVDLYR